MERSAWRRLCPSRQRRSSVARARAEEEDVVLRETLSLDAPGLARVRREACDEEVAEALIALRGPEQEERIDGPYRGTFLSVEDGGWIHLERCPTMSTSGWTASEFLW